MYGLRNVRSRRDNPLSKVPWNQLESLLAIYYRGQGYRVDHVGTGGTSSRFDGGIDLKLYKDDEYVIAECKHWNATSDAQRGASVARHHAHRRRNRRDLGQQR